MATEVEERDSTDKEFEQGEQIEDQNDTLLSGLREKRKEISKARHLDLEIPGYDGDLWARYEPVEWDDIAKVSDKLEKSKNPRKALYAQADILARTLRQIMVKVNGELRPMEDVFPELGDQPIKFDARLAQALDFTINPDSPVRSAVLQTFNNDLAVSAQHQVVLEWLQSSSREDDRDF